MATAEFVHRPAPDNPGWTVWDIDDPERFNPAVIGRLIVRAQGERSARMRMLEPGHRHANLHGRLHGGVTLALADIAMFASAYVVCGGHTAASVTIDLNCQFLGSGSLERPVDVVTEILRETRRLIFARGMVEQDGDPIAAFSGTLRKPSVR
ncbi:thioesterase [Novosphingobium sp. PC22D]|nr:thioesterase [Novosphingobium sp. PC22D]